MSKHKIFIVTAHPYKHDIIVSVGASAKQVRRAIHKPEKELDVLLKDYANLFDEILEGRKLGYSLRHVESHHIVLILPEYKDTWLYWEALIHELSHVVDWIVEFKMLQGETEARAYLTEYLFSSIRRKIQNVKPLKSV